MKLVLVCPLVSLYDISKIGINVDDQHAIEHTFYIARSPPYDDAVSWYIQPSAYC